MKMKWIFFAVVALLAGAAVAGVLPPDVLMGLSGMPLAFGTVQTAAGATIKVKAGNPGTYNAAGYASLFSASPAGKLVGEITDFGEFGREYNLVTHNPVASRGTQKFKGSFNEGQMTLQIGLDTDDVGQIEMKAASTSDSNYSFEVALLNGDKYYFQAKVMSWKVGVGNVDSIVSATAVLELTTNSAGVGIVESLAP